MKNKIGSQDGHLRRMCFVEDKAQVEFKFYF